MDYKLQQAWKKTQKLFEAENKADQIPGGFADKSSVSSLAKKHDVSKDVIIKQVQVGVKIEMEHTDDVYRAVEISLDHIFENPYYYNNPHGTDLVDMEKEAEAEN